MIDTDLTDTNGCKQVTDIYFSLNGETVSYEEFDEMSDQQIVKRMADLVREEVELIRCPIHGEPASSITFTETDEKISYEVDGCCDTLGDRVERQMR